jgi:hypothetical protein
MKARPRGRRVGGRRKSTARVGLRPALVFAAICLLAAVLGIMVELSFGAWR